MTMPAYILDAHPEDFNTLVLENSHKGPVMVNFWSAQAGPCMILMPRLIKLAKDFGGRFLLVNLDTAEYGQFARQQGVISIPHVKLFRDGKVIDELRSAESNASLKRFIDKHLPHPTSAPHLQAIRIHSQGDSESAIRQLAQAAMENPNDTGIVADMLKLMMLEHQYQRAAEVVHTLPLVIKKDSRIRDLHTHLDFIQAAEDAPEKETLLARITADTQDLEARYLLAASCLVDNDFRLALDQLAEILQLDLEFRDHIGERGLRAIFATLKDEDELLAPYRRLLQTQTHK